MVQAAFPLGFAFGSLFIHLRFHRFFERFFVEMVSRHECLGIERAEQTGALFSLSVLPLMFGSPSLTLCRSQGADLLTLIGGQIEFASHLTQETHPILAVFTPHPPALTVTASVHSLPALTLLIHAVLATLSPCTIAVSLRAAGHQRCRQTQTGQCQYDYFCFHCVSFNYNACFPTSWDSAIIGHFCEWVVNEL